MTKGSVLRSVLPGVALAAALAMSGLVALAGPGGFAGDSDGVSSSDAGGSTAGGDVDSGGGETDCALTVLNDGAASYLVLEEHVSDPDMPEGGKAGNQNALDKICFRTLHGENGGTTLVTGDGSPGKSGDAPGRTGEAPGLSEGGADSTGSEPGKSEDAPGEPGARGPAHGQGQEDADAMGVGPAEAPGRSGP